MVSSATKVASIVHRVFAHKPGATSAPLSKVGQPFLAVSLPRRHYHHRFSSLLFSSTYKSLFQQLPCFHIYTKRPGWGVSALSPDLQLPVSPVESASGDYAFDTESPRIAQ